MSTGWQINNLLYRIETKKSRSHGKLPCDRFFLYGGEIHNPNLWLGLILGCTILRGFCRSHIVIHNLVLHVKNTGNLITDAAAGLVIGHQLRHDLEQILVAHAEYGGLLCLRLGERGWLWIRCPCRA